MTNPLNSRACYHCLKMKNDKPVELTGRPPLSQNDKTVERAGLPPLSENDKPVELTGVPPLSENHNHVEDMGVHHCLKMTNPLNSDMAYYYPVSDATGCWNLAVFMLRSRSFPYCFCCL